MHKKAWFFKSNTVLGILAFMLVFGIIAIGCGDPESDPVTYVVTFDTGEGGSAVPEQKVKQDGKVTKPANPSKAGYTFTNWYRDAATTTLWNFDTDMVVANITLYAKWVLEENAPSFTVTFDSQGGSQVSPIDVTSGGKITLPENPTKSDFRFGGWYSEGNGSGTKFTGDTPVNSDITVFAYWKESLQIPDGVNNATNPAAIPATGLFTTQNGLHDADVAAVTVQKDWDIIFIGDSLIEYWNDDLTGATDATKPIQSSWTEIKTKYDVLNMGIGADRTQNVLWRLENNALPHDINTKYIVLLVGVNNLGTIGVAANSPEEVAGGIAKIIETLNDACPTAKILLVSILPQTGGYENNDRVNEIIENYDGHLNTTFVDARPGFFYNGTVNDTLFLDGTHLTSAGYTVLKRALFEEMSDLPLADEYTVMFISEGKVYRTMTAEKGTTLTTPNLPLYTGSKWFTGQNETGTEFTSATPVNSDMIVYAGDSGTFDPLVSLGIAETDSALLGRAVSVKGEFQIGKHEAVLEKIAAKKNYDIVFLGDSILQYWGDTNGEGEDNYTSWTDLTTDYDVLNLGVGGDETMDVIWRIENGEMPNDLVTDYLVLLIGTNNSIMNYPSHSAAQIAAANSKIIERIHASHPATKIILVSLLPRNFFFQDGTMNIAVNNILKAYDGYSNVSYLDIYDAFAASPGSTQPNTNLFNAEAGFFGGFDYIHPNANGYSVFKTKLYEKISEMEG
ncbi:MAG: InlB B-repeat-containing protein [Treponema sp.]|jgi:uncharacterized repeat protein (TIGR02543 family)|nr:InlB B-repeat-containing protein [Treponema sp.]